MDSLCTPFKGFAYHPHQEEAIRWMMAREDKDTLYFKGGILADEMGLGKTWMTIGLMLNKPVAQTLLLVPPVLQTQWCEALTASSISYSVLRAPEKPAKARAAKAGAPRAKGYRRPGALVPAVAGAAVCIAGIHVVLATYDRATHNTALLGTMTFDRIICDEGHIFRNGGKTMRFQRLASLESSRRWILSGTPIQNRRTDFQNLMAFLGMSPEDRLAVPYKDAAAAVLLRRTVSEVREAVPTMPTLRPVHKIHPVSMPVGSEEETIFNALVGRFENAVEGNARVTIILELYLRIRQFLAHPAIYVDAMKRKFKTEYSRDTWTGTASKMEAFRTIVSTGEKTPTIVFGTFRAELDYASAILTDAGYKVFRIQGGMSEALRSTATAESRAAAEAGEPVAIVIQIMAGNAGLNLQHCSRIVFLSSHWNPAVVDQAVGRAYRMGQTKRVHVHHILLADDAEKNLDRYMAKLHGTKRTAALDVHPKLFCDSAADTDATMKELDKVLPVVVPEAYEDTDDPE